MQALGPMFILLVILMTSINMIHSYKFVTALRRDSRNNIACTSRRIQIPLPHNVASSTESLSLTEKTSINANKDSSSIGGIESIEPILNIRNVIPFPMAHLSKTLIYRSACPTNVTTSNEHNLSNSLQIKTYIDLRSYTELNEDKHLKNDFFQTILNIYDSENKSLFLQYVTKVYIMFRLRLWKSKASLHSLFESSSNSPLSTLSSTSNISASTPRIYFIPLASHQLIARGLLSRMSLYLKLQLLCLLPFAMFFKKQRNKLKKIFVNQLNQGGLSLLYEIVIDQCGPQIVKVLKLLSNSDNHPVLFYCKAGKDRTGIVSMFVHHLRGVSEEDILNDFYLSNTVYKVMNDPSATIASLRQDAGFSLMMNYSSFRILYNFNTMYSKCVFHTGLNLKEFVGAPKDVMKRTIEYIKQKYGSIENYLELHGFSVTDRKKLQAL